MELLSPTEAVRYLDKHHNALISRHTLASWRRAPGKIGSRADLGPKRIKHRHRVYYLSADLDDWCRTPAAMPFKPESSSPKHALA